MNDALNKFKAEMEKRGLFRKITVAANLIPPPPGLNPEALISIHKLAAKEALIIYAQKHDDFSDLLAEAAFDNLFDTILTDDLFKPVGGGSHLLTRNGPKWRKQRKPLKLFPACSTF